MDNYVCPLLYDQINSKNIRTRPRLGELRLGELSLGLSQL